MDSKHWDDVKCKKYEFPRRVYTLFALNGGHLGFIIQVTRPLGTSQQSRFIISMLQMDADEISEEISCSVEEVGLLYCAICIICSAIRKI